MAAQIIQFPQRDELYTIGKNELQALITESVSSAMRGTTRKRTHMTPEERQQKLSPIKTNGVKKATAAHPIRDPKELKAIRGYFSSNSMYREYAIFSVGLTLGIRANDLLALKVKDFMNEDGTFKDRLDVIEMKTDKRNQPLLTDYAKEALSLYLAHRNKVCSPEEPMFLTNRLSPCSLSLFNQNLLKCGEALNLRLSSHCMRHTFAYLMNTHGSSETSDNLDYMSLIVTQMAMNHANLYQTLSYTGLSQEMMDEKRKAVSDFLLENT